MAKQQALSKRREAWLVGPGSSATPEPHPIWRLCAENCSYKVTM